jgi:uncharacterized protein YndB with AHSA1/START domain
MSVDVTAEVLIAQPRELVASYAMDPDNAPSWHRNVRSIHWRTEPPLRRGSRFTFVPCFHPRRSGYTYEVIEYVPDERVTMRNLEGPFPMETTYLWLSMPRERTRMILRNRGEPTGFALFIAPLMLRFLRRANYKDLSVLKAKLERKSPF